MLIKPKGRGSSVVVSTGTGERRSSGGVGKSCRGEGVPSSLGFHELEEVAVFEEWNEEEAAGSVQQAVSE